jgi:hypothetical protein
MNEFLDNIKQITTVVDNLTEEEKKDSTLFEKFIRAFVLTANKLPDDAETQVQNRDLYIEALHTFSFTMQKKFGQEEQFKDGMLSLSTSINNIVDLLKQSKVEPAKPADTTGAAAAAAPSTPTGSAEKANPPQSGSGAPTEKEKELFKKFHASEFDPNSSMDRGKLEQLRQAAGNVGSEDENKLRQKSYDLQYNTNKTSQSSPAKKTINATDPISRPGGPTYYIRNGFNRYSPAVQADLTSGQQLFMKNPNPIARGVYPYVKVDSRPIRRASPAR